MVILGRKAAVLDIPGRIVNSLFLLLPDFFRSINPPRTNVNSFSTSSRTYYEFLSAYS